MGRWRTTEPEMQKNQTETRYGVGLGWGVNNSRYKRSSSSEFEGGGEV